MEKRILEMSFSSSITVDSVKEFIEKLQLEIHENPDATTLQIAISSPGGDVAVAIELYHFLRNLGCKIHTCNTSYVNSASNIIYIAGDVRTCYSYSTFYVHSITKRLRGNYNADQLLKYAKEMNVNSCIVADLMSKRTGKSNRYWKIQMGKGCILTSAQAVKAGLVTELIK